MGRHGSRAEQSPQDQQRSSNCLSLFGNSQPRKKSGSSTHSSRTSPRSTPTHSLVMASLYPRTSQKYSSKTPSSWTPSSSTTHSRSCLDSKNFATRCKQPATPSLTESCQPSTKCDVKLSVSTAEAAVSRRRIVFCGLPPFYTNKQISFNLEYILGLCNFKSENVVQSRVTHIISRTEACLWVTFVTDMQAQIVRRKLKAVRAKDSEFWHFRK